MIPRWRTRFALVATLVLVGAAAAAGVAAPAWAHNVLRETQPADEARLAEGPGEVTLTFDQEVAEQYGTIVVTGPEGGRWQDGDPQVTDNVVTQKLLPLGPAGGYEVSWRVISADGHPVSGTFSFTVTSAGDGTPLPEPVEPEDDEQSWLPLAGLLVLAALAVVGVVVAVSLVLNRRRPRGGQDDS